MSPALAGRFLTTAPSGKSQSFFVFVFVFVFLFFFKLIRALRQNQPYLDGAVAEAALPHLLAHLMLSRHLIVIITPILQRGRLTFHVSAGIGREAEGKGGGASPRQVSCLGCSLQFLGSGRTDLCHHDHLLRILYVPDSGTSSCLPGGRDP